MDFDLMKLKYSYTEVLYIVILKQIEKSIHALGCALHCVKVQDTEKNTVEYFGS